MPTAWAPIVGRLRSSVCMATLNPSPIPPRRWVSGTRTPSSRITPVGDARIPSLCSSLSISTPQPASTRNAVMPLWRSSEVRANTVYTSETLAFVIHVFDR